MAGEQAGVEDERNEEPQTQGGEPQAGGEPQTRRSVAQVVAVIRGRLAEIDTLRHGQEAEERALLQRRGELVGLLTELGEQVD